MITFKLPDLGEGLPDAEIRQWYVAEGDEVQVDQPIVAMETAKAMVDVPSPHTGRIEKLYGKPGETIKTGDPLVAFAGEPPHSDTGTVVGEIQSSDILPENAQVLLETKTESRSTIKAIPAIRALAAQLQVDLATVTATGPGGAVTAEDVRRAANAAAASTVTAEIASKAGTPLQGARRIMAMQMAKSHAEVVPVTLFEDVDLHLWPKSSDITVRFVRAIIAACTAVPVLNSHFHGGENRLQTFQEVNVGIAVDTPEALYVPVIKNAAAQSAAELRQKLNEFKAKASTHHFSSEELKGATITLTNFGTIAGRYSTPIIIPPMTSIIGFGKIRPSVVAFEGQAVVHSILPISLTFDHRAITGGEAARFIAALLNELQME